ncbi:MAG TPA: TlpA disulfide reductase family protein [Acidimicrobiia bacterium]|nr:TlpA disulfide reductase family protein [Acidimicrobiia bacterium]
MGWVLPAVLLAAVVVGAVTYLSADTSTTTSPTGPATSSVPPDPSEASVAGVATVGSVAPDFDLPRLRADGSVHLADLRGRPVVVNFWASWCIPCRKEFPMLERARRKYRDRGLVIIGVDFRDIAADAKAFANGEGATWSLVTDPGREAALAYGVRGIPQTFFIRPDGTIAERYFTSPSSQAVMNQEIESLIPPR